MKIIDSRFIPDSSKYLSFEPVVTCENCGGYGFTHIRELEDCHRWRSCEICEKRHK